MFFLRVCWCSLLDMQAGWWDPRLQRRLPPAAHSLSSLLPAACLRLEMALKGKGNAPNPARQHKAGVHTTADLT